MGKNTTKPALDRIADLEAQLQRIMMVMGQAFGQFEQKLAQQDEVLTATVICTGREQVTAKITERRKERREAEIVKEKELLAKSVELGLITKAEQISEESLIVGSEMNVEGTAGNPFLQVLYSSLLPEYQEKLLLKGVGEKIETPTKGVFEVLAVYQPAVGVNLDETTLEELIDAKEAEKKAAEAPAVTETPAPDAGAGQQT